MPNNLFTQGYSASSGGLNDMMKGMTFFSIILYLMTINGQSMNYMVLLVRSLQIIMHLPMLQIILPANVMTLFSVMIPTVSFDILESLVNWDE